MKLKSLTATGKFSTVTASDVLFSGKVNTQLLTQAIRVYRSNKRQGTSKVKTRAEVILTKRKVYKQKGTGNARHGAKSAPIFVGGGVAHGPDGTQNWSLDLSKKMRKIAVVSALRAQKDAVIVAEQHEAFTGKTKEAVAFLNLIEAIDKKVLFLVSEPNAKMAQSVNNIKKVALQTVAKVNAFDVSSADVIVLSKKAVTALEERLSTSRVKKTETDNKNAKGRK